MSSASDSNCADVTEESLPAPELISVVEEISDRIQRGESLNIEHYAQAHPEHAQYLRELEGTLRAVAEMGHKPTENNPFGTSTIEGKQIGEFRLIRQIGEGGMGLVFEAEQQSLDRRVALKVLQMAGVLDERQLTRFRNEARAAATLHHPNIVPVFAVGSDRGVHYYAMQFIDGPSLAEILSEVKKTSGKTAALTEQEEQCSSDSLLSAKTRLELEVSISKSGTQPDSFIHKVAHWGVQAAEALAFAHENGVLHRDIKPGNLLIDQSGKLWVTDFGLARIEREASMTISGTLIGTVRYMSPEQALAKRQLIDHRSDVYSLGATLYELLTFQPLFVGDDYQELLKQISFAEPQPLRSINATIPTELETIVLKATYKEPFERYDSAQALADDLQRFLDNKPIQAKPPSLLQLAIKWSRRNQTAMWSLIAILFVTGATLLVSQFFISRTNRQLRVATTDLKAALASEAKATESALAAEHRSQDLLFAADVRLAGEAITNNNLIEARERLSRHIPANGEPDRRGFAWHYLWGQLQQSDMVFEEYGPAFDVEYSTDGKILASSHESGEVVFYDAESGNKLNVLNDSQDLVRKIDFSKDGKLIIGVSDDGNIFVWRVDDGKLIASALATEPGAADVAFHPDNRQFATITWDQANLYRLEIDNDLDPEDSTIKKIATFDHSDSGLHDVDISADGRWLALGGSYSLPNYSGEVRIWDLNTKERVYLRRLSPKITTVSFAKHQEKLAIGTVDGTILLWDYAKKGSDITWKHGAQRIYDIDFSSDDSKVISASKDSTAWCWDVEKNQLLMKVQGHETRVYGTAINPLTDQVATASKDGTVRVWNIDSKTTSISTIKSPYDARKARFAPDGESFVELLSNEVVLKHDLTTGDLSELPLSSVRTPRLDWQVSGKHLILSGKEVIDSRRLPGPTNVIEVDTDGDGDLDRIAVFGVQHQTVWQERLSDSEWAAPRLKDETNRASEMAYQVDINNDGHDETLTSHPAAGIWSGNIRLTNIGVWGLGWADFDSDGDLDLVAADRSKGFLYWHAQEEGTEVRPVFKRQINLSKELLGYSTVIAQDFTNDGLPDVVASNLDWKDYAIYFFTNRGEGKFSQAKLLNEAPGPEFLELADVDQDGWPDLLVANIRHITYYKNKKGKFSGAEKRIQTLENANWARQVPRLATEIYDLETLQLNHRILGKVDSGPRRMSLSADGNQFAIVSDMKNLDIWDLSSDKIIHTIPSTELGVSDITYSGDGKYLLGAVGDDLRVWSSTDYSLLHTFKGHDNTIEMICVSPDGQMVATLSDDLSVRLWRLLDGRHLRTFLGHKSLPILATFTKDSRRLATAAEDGTVRIWDTNTGQQLLVLDEASDLLLIQPSVPPYDLTFRDDNNLSMLIKIKGKRHTRLVEWTARTLD